MGTLKAGAIHQLFGPGFSLSGKRRAERPQQVEAGRVKSAWGPGRGLGDAGQLGAVGAFEEPRARLPAGKRGADSSRVGQRRCVQGAVRPAGGHQ